MLDEAAEILVGKRALLAYMHRHEATKTGGGKAPASSSEVSKPVADVITASVDPLEQEKNMKYYDSRHDRSQHQHHNFR